VERSDLQTVGIITPAPPGSLSGNRVTARRWEGILHALGKQVFVAAAWDSEEDPPCDALVALHAVRSRDSALAFRAAHPDRLLVVVGTGTDLYPDGGTPDLSALEAADVIVVLQELALDALPAALRRKAQVVHQSFRPEGDAPAENPDAFEVVSLAHLRPVKAPFLAAEAVARLPATSSVQVLHAGAALDPASEERATAESERNPRWTWLGEQARPAAIDLLRRSRLLLSTSEREGGANAVSEAMACGVPILATGIPGTVGLLGADHPGLFPVGDATALAALLLRAEEEPAFLTALVEAGNERAWITDPEHERAAWARILERP